MFQKRKLVIISVLITCMLFSLAAIQAPVEPGFKNLKVLPKDISAQMLDYIMDEEFCKGLGVKCKYCHAKTEDGTDLDFASDAKPEKEIARKMMLMSLDINQKYFGSSHPFIGDSTASVTCITCHRGDPYPGNAVQGIIAPFKDKDDLKRKFF